MRSKNIALWIIQVLLALMFLFSGVMKFVMPIEVMTKQVPLPGPFLHFIGVAEVLGGIGLVVPWLTHIRPALTPLAAAGLTIIMIGATVVSAMYVSVPQAVLPLVVGILTAIVAYGRWHSGPPDAQAG